MSSYSCLTGVCDLCPQDSCFFFTSSFLSVSEQEIMRNSRLLQTCCSMRLKGAAGIKSFADIKCTVAHSRVFFLLSFELQRSSGQRGPARVRGGSTHCAVISGGSMDFACSSMFTPMLVGNSSSKFAAVSVIPRAVQTLVFVDHFSQPVLTMIHVCCTRGSRR